MFQLLIIIKHLYVDVVWHDNTKPMSIFHRLGSDFSSFREFGLFSASIQRQWFIKEQFTLCATVKFIVVFIRSLILNKIDGLQQRIIRKVALQFKTLKIITCPYRQHLFHIYSLKFLKSLLHAGLWLWCYHYRLLYRHH